MEVSIRALSGAELATICLERAATVKDLKRAIERLDGTPEIVQQLVCNNRTLDESPGAPPLAAQLDGNGPVVLVKRDLAELQDQEAKTIIERYGRKYRRQHHFFWAVHEGNALAIVGLLRFPDVDVNAEMMPSDFLDAKSEHAWPYCSFDGRYMDRALHLAVRCRDEASVEALLSCRADPSLLNDNAESAMDIALGRGVKWKCAFVEPKDFGGKPARIMELLQGPDEP